MRRLVIALASVALIVGPAVSPPSSASASPSASATESSDASTPTITISGHGWGHGVGMGQYGAYGYALSGESYLWILDHYYGGTVMAPASTATVIKVQLVELDGASTVTVKDSAGTHTLRPGPTPFKPAGGIAWVEGRWPEGAWRPFPGEIEVVATGGTYETLNLVPIEYYVQGVVPAESPSSWGIHGEAALQAQAVAARSYALAYTAGGQYPICDNTWCQVYGGDPNVGGDLYYSAYVGYSDHAQSTTAGEVREFSNRQVAATEFSSSTGGYTAGGPFPAVVDYGDATPSNPNHNWAVTLPITTVESAFPSVGPLESIEVTQRNGLGDMGGRVLQMVVAGRAGHVTVTGDEFAAALGLRSDWFGVSGLNGTIGGDNGYWVVAANGGVYPFGEAPNLGSMSGHALNAPVIGMAPTAGGQGYWLVGGDGGIFTFGDARFYGSTGNIRLNRPVIGMASTASGHGYWLYASDGGIFTFGDAAFHGSTGGIRLNQPVVGMASTPDGKGYWLVAADGGVFTFGDAHYYGSTGNVHLFQPVVGMVATRDGHGYWLVGRDGGIFSFGDAGFVGSLPGKGIKDEIVSVSPSGDGEGYVMLGLRGSVYAFGDAPYFGSPASTIPGWSVASLGIFMHA